MWPFESGPVIELIKTLNIRPRVCFFQKFRALGWVARNAAAGEIRAD